MNRVISYPFGYIEVEVNDHETAVNIPDIINGDEELTRKLCMRIVNDSADGVDVADPLYVSRVFCYFKALFFVQKKMLKRG
jgi:hypothetical protein